MTNTGEGGVTAKRTRMSGHERREQLLDIARTLFAERGYEATSIEEVAQRAKVSKPVVYEHFKGKEGLYAVVVDREMQRLFTRITEALDARHPRQLLGQAADAFLLYVEEEADGFRVLVRDSPIVSESGGLASLVGDVATRVEYILAGEFRSRGYDPKLAPLYSRALIGMVAQVGGWWLETGKPSRQTVAAHLVNLAWNGLSHLEVRPEPVPRHAASQRARRERARVRAERAETDGGPVPHKGQKKGQKKARKKAEKKSSKKRSSSSARPSPARSSG